MILDATHLCDDSFRDALDHLPRADLGQPLELPGAGASRSPVQRRADPGADRARRRHRRGVRRLDARARLDPRHHHARTRGVTLETVADHIDHICQLAGNARHCGIGSDLDGAFGREQCPADLDTIADLARLPEILRGPRLLRGGCRGHRARQLHSLPAGGVGQIAASYPLPASRFRLRLDRCSSAARCSALSRTSCKPGGTHSPKAGSRKREAGSGKQEAGSRKQAAGSR